MARILGVFPAAILAAKAGMSANAFYRELQRLGMGAKRSEVLALYKIARGIEGGEGYDVGQNPKLKPSGPDLGVWPTNKATGVKQNITLAYRDRTTGEILKTYFSVTSPEGVTREEAVNAAIGAYSDAAERYGQDLIGAVHTSAYRLVPTGLDLGG